MYTSVIHLIFHGDLVDLLPRGKRQQHICFPLRRRASIKDVIESLAIPHTEIGRIDKNGRFLTFHHIAGSGERLHIFPFTADNDVLRPSALRPDPFSTIAFMADATVSKLGRNMRMAGIDTADAPQTPFMRHTDIAELADAEERILLSRNRDLLKCAVIRFGQLLRSDNHLTQLHEVFSRYTIASPLAPFTRCLLCNEELIEVDKKDIFDILQPLTRRYYHRFKICPLCEKIYWHGSHVEKMQKSLKMLCDNS